MAYETLAVRRDGAVEYVTLNRPEVRNALNATLVAELGAWARSAAEDGTLRAAVLDGAGKAFSAGADLDWMRASAGYTREQNIEDASRLAAMFDALDRLPVPLVGRVHGAALGGGCGLVAVCDIVVAEEQTVFGFTEAKLGLIPAVISPYVLAKIGPSAARELFLTAARFSAARARELGLVHAVASANGLEPVVAAQVTELLSSAPAAVRAAKTLIRSVLPPDRDRITRFTVEATAERRVSAEGQEGMRAFLEKRRPGWID